ncbi:hypothetical protein EI171_00505 (plasmid) [Bradyrhizobium sp. LCT2]|uniref:hypothetical protein n=1 Tax=Bradyrhizobium sp. LCT2 TaxID=2493093 RepID=UPI0013743CF3|nr:hypothetical protein [Bradyrhizobium sp. LCT2]QHP66065.1 hypothetical protein EI171_00505 [Bradyrhizobium sp. LCT2]
MTRDTTSVGGAIASALERAEELRSLSDRPARVRIMTIFGDDRSGLTINARIAARTPAEHRAQEGLGTRCIPWDELDARAGEIVGLVDAVVGEVTLAVQNTPPVPRPSRSEDDLELAVFDDLIDELGQTITLSALSVLEKHPAKQVSRELGSEAAMLAALKFAVLAAYTGHVGLNDAQDELRMAMGEVMNKMLASPELARRPNLNS